MHNGERVTFPIHNAGTTGKIDRPDTDWPKKLETNTISKALSKLGFNADVFMGQFDDGDYVQSLQMQEYIDKADDKDAAVLSAREELTEYVTNHLESIEKASITNEVNGIVRAATRHLSRQGTLPDLADIATRGAKAIAINGEKKNKLIEGKNNE